MKKIIASLAMIALVGSLTVGATRAWFTSNKIVPNNTLGAGTLYIDWRGTVSSTFNISNMEPGVWYGTGGEYLLTVFNHSVLSTMNAKYRFRTSFVSQTEPGMWGLMNVMVYRKEGASWVNYYNGQLKNMVIDPTLVPVMGNLPVGNSHDWKFEFQLDSSATDTYQGDSVTFDLLLDATQTGNPGW